MKDKLIKNYISKITKTDILEFAKKNDINLNDNELEYIYNIIKNQYQEILYGDFNNIFKNLKNNINNDSYQKIVKLFFIYKEKYQSFL